MAPSSTLLLAALLGCIGITASTSGDDDIILPPFGAQVSSQDVMLAFLPGGAVPNRHYEPTVKAIQKAADGVRLWGVIPAVFKRLCSLQCVSRGLCSPLHNAVQGALAAAAERGWRRSTGSVWLAGHSLGGICANTLFQAYSSNGEMPYAGLIVMGSYVDTAGDFDVLHYPRPVLTLNAELDTGMARPGKTAIWWEQHLQARAKDKQEALRRKPVIVLPKLNHSAFCPGFDVFFDVMAEVDQASATLSVGRAVAAFLQLNAAGNVSEDVELAALETMEGFSDWTSKLLTPYLAAQDMERDGTVGNGGGGGMSPLCASAQHVLSGLSEESSGRHLVVEDEYQASSGGLKSCHTNFSRAGGSLVVKTCSHADYYPNLLNLGSVTAARQVACKMISAARIAQKLGTMAPTHQVSCREANRRTVEVAEALATPETLERYRRRGRRLCLLEDYTVPGNVGPLWLLSSLRMEQNETCMAVSSPTLLTSLESKIYPGNKYCKLLSPARVLDWMMSDSLKPPQEPAAVTPAPDELPLLIAPAIHGQSPNDGGAEEKAMLSGAVAVLATFMWLRMRKRGARQGGMEPRRDSRFRGPSLCRQACLQPPSRRMGVV